MNKGFTLIETIVAVFILSVITTGLFSIIPAIYRVDSYAWHQAHATNEARRGMKTMIREIREAITGEDGSYVLLSAQDNELIFFSDIDKDNDIERVRYFLGGTSDYQQTQECVTYIDGGSCSIVFSDFFNGTLNQAVVQVGVKGDFGLSSELANIYADSVLLGSICSSVSSCEDCSTVWNGIMSFDVMGQASDNYLQLTADASSYVNDICSPGYFAMRAQFQLNWQAEEAGKEREFKRGVVEPIGDIPQYLTDTEEITVLSRYVQNQINSPQKTVFKYYDKDGQEIIDPIERINSTKIIKIMLIVNVEPNRAPDDYYLQSKVQLRNLIFDNE
ncbi:prepilin-type N-terminal cleavage/methylation domain-containing protein [Patescibacteria group bacterium]|nr:prepilin-type N-terminal cleavage/methylation domain-containing protein [Patescibacteria group bacterium]MBU4162302.1 prepilin-type N-terminal cleavage/methylation domain-containing protein [Patescibacteria group bacterium]